MSDLKADITLSPELQKKLAEKPSASLMDIATLVIAGGGALFAVLLGVAQILKTILSLKKPS
jgi:hypothetical protein